MSTTNHIRYKNSVISQNPSHVCFTLWFSFSRFSKTHNGYKCRTDSVSWAGGSMYSSFISRENLTDTCTLTDGTFHWHRKLKYHLFTETNEKEIPQLVGRNKLWFFLKQKSTRMHERCQQDAGTWVMLKKEALGHEKDTNIKPSSLNQ